MFIPLTLFWPYRAISMASLACSGAHGAVAIAPTSSSSGSPDSYNGHDARRYLYWWKGTRNLYSEAIREVGHLRLRLEATLAAAEGEISAAQDMLSDADGIVAGTVLLFKHNLFSTNKDSIITVSLFSTWKALEEQIQVLYQAVNIAATIVNARGNLLVDRLQDIPNHARDIATHRVRQGAAAALAVAQTCTRHKLHLLEPVFLEGEDRAGFNEIVI